MPGVQQITDIKPLSSLKFQKDFVPDLSLTRQSFFSDIFAEIEYSCPHSSSCVQ